MKGSILACLLLAANTAGAQLYRWVDEKGVTNYGEKPPADRKAQPVNAQPAGTLESRTLPHPKADDAAPRAASADKPPRGMEFETYIRLEAGMTEGELLLRAGKPDHESVENFRGDIVKSWYYYPTSSNPYLTLVTLRGGRVAGLERNRKTY